MTSDQHDGEEQVRRLLGASGGPERMPDDVKLRLDDVLADLVAERSGAPVVTLSARRRPRWPQLLVAAAVISVVALGIGGVGRLTGTSSDSGAVSAQAGGAAENGGSRDEFSPAQPSKTREPASSLAKDNALLMPFDPAVGRLHTDSLGADVRRLVRTTTATRLPATADLARARCDLPKTRKGDRLFAVRLDGHRATLRVPPPEAGGAGTRVAQIYSCDDGDVSRATATLPARGSNQ